MAIKRYLADADNTIVNAYQPNLETRGTGSNTGRSDIVEVYSIYGRQQPSSSTYQGSQELSRILMKFPTTSIAKDRTNSVIPASGSVNFYLKVFNAPHTRTVPRDLTLMVYPVSQSWQEGEGLDLINYTDLTKGRPGSNWLSASNTAAWTEVGGTYITASNQWDHAASLGAPPIYSQSFTTGLEDLEIDITPLVEVWLDSKLDNYGVGIQLTSSQEAYYSGSTVAGFKKSFNTGSILNITGGAMQSYYTKRFFARGTQYFFKRPVIEARWDSSKRDDRGNFYYSSSLAPGPDNLNTIYLYNYVRGQLRDIPAVGATGSLNVSLYSGSSDDSAPSGSKLILYNGYYTVTGSWKSTGIYTASIAVTAAATPIETLYDVWWSGSTEYVTGAIKPDLDVGFKDIRDPVYYINVTNLKNQYSTKETARLNLFVRSKFWNPTIYTKANTAVENSAIISASYRVFRVVDGTEAVQYDTGSTFGTGLSYDVSGNYFDFDMGLLKGGYTYGFKFAFYDPELSSWIEQNKVFKFRVKEYEY